MTIETHPVLQDLLESFRPTRPRTVVNDHGIEAIDSLPLQIDCSTPEKLQAFCDKVHEIAARDPNQTDGTAMLRLAAIESGTMPPHTCTDCGGRHSRAPDDYRGDLCTGCMHDSMCEDFHR